MTRRLPFVHTLQRVDSLIADLRRLAEQQEPVDDALMVERGPLIRAIHKSIALLEAARSCYHSGDDK